MTSRRLSLLALATALVLSACGGTTGATSDAPSAMPRLGMSATPGGSGDLSTKASEPSPSSATPSGDLGSLKPCDYISDEAVGAVIPADIGNGEEHLSALPDFRDCVFFAGDSAAVTVGLRQEPTAAATADALVLELFPSDEATRATIGQLHAHYLSCAHVWSSCRPAIAFGLEPYFFVISIRAADGNEDVAVALARAVVAYLTR